MAEGEKRVDEEWKRRARQEREEAARRTGAPEAAEATFLSLVQSLAYQALVALGVEPDPVAGTTECNLEQASYLIDLLGVVEDRTQGNLSPEESRALSSALQQLRMLYVEVASRVNREARPGY